MKTFVKDAIFLTIAAVIILPMPTLVLAYMTVLSFLEILYR